MQADLRLLDFPGGACRVYTWDGPWVSLGRFQKPDRDVVPGFENWVIRPTGGKAVLHGHDMTVALSFPFDGGLHAVREAFELAVQPLVDALNRCGLPCLMAGVRGLERGKRTSDCFAVTSGFDVVHRDSEDKVCGCALLLTNGSVLMQASIPFKEPLIDPASAITAGKRSPVHRWEHEQLANALR
jgi:lipoate-protein ligase A